MAATAMVAARIEPELKDRADKVLGRAHVTGSELIRRVYEYVAFNGDVPEFVYLGSREVDMANPSRRVGSPLATWAVDGPYAGLDLRALDDDEVAAELGDARE